MIHKHASVLLFLLSAICSSCFLILLVLQMTFKSNQVYSVCSPKEHSQEPFASASFDYGLHRFKEREKPTCLEVL